MQFENISPKLKRARRQQGWHSVASRNILLGPTIAAPYTARLPPLYPPTRMRQLHPASYEAFLEIREEIEFQILFLLYSTETK